MRSTKSKWTEEVEVDMKKLVDTVTLKKLEVTSLLNIIIQIGQEIVIVTENAAIKKGELN